MARFPNLLCVSLSAALLAGPALAEGGAPPRVNGFTLIVPPADAPGPGDGRPVTVGRYGCAPDRGQGVRTGIVAGMAAGAVAGLLLDGSDRLESTAQWAWLGGIGGGFVGALASPSDPAARCHDAAVAAAVAERTDHWQNPLRGYDAQEPEPFAPASLWDDRDERKRDDRRTLDTEDR